MIMTLFHSLRVATIVTVLMLQLFAVPLAPTYAAGGGDLDETFNPGAGADDAVYAIALQADGKAIIGGAFTIYNGAERNRLARLNPDGSLDKTFNVGKGADNEIDVIAIQPDGKIIIGGMFTLYNSVPRNHLARLNVDGTLDTTFNVGDGADDVISAIVVQPDGKILIGGAFNNYDGVERNFLARLNADGSLDSTFNLNSGIDDFVSAVALQPDGKIIIGGGFITYDNLSRNHLARLNADGTLDAAFTVGAGTDDVISVIALQPDGKILISGNFTVYDGTSRNRIARLNPNGPLDSTFNPGKGANDIILALALQTDGKIIIGGAFTTYDGKGRNFVARLNADGSADTLFAPLGGADDFVSAVVLQANGKTIIGGAFTTYNGLARHFLVRLNADSSPDTTFNPNSGADDTILAIAIQPDSKIIVSGSFTTYNSLARRRIARLNVDSSLDTTFNPGRGADEDVNVIALQPNGKIVIGGSFTTYNGVGRNRIARLNADGSLDTTFNPRAGADDAVNAIAIQPDGKILIGGSFATYNDVERNFIARLNTDGSLDTAFDPRAGANDAVNTIALQPDGKIIIGGSFTAYNDVERNFIARLNADGSLDTSFDVGAGADNIVLTLALQSDGKVIIGGAFRNYDRTERQHIARLNADGSLDTIFRPDRGVDGEIEVIVLHTDKIIIGGMFTAYDNVERNNIARLNSDGSLDLSFNPGRGTDEAVLAIALQRDARVVIGGGFTNYDSRGRNFLARLGSP